jgi:prepilin-type N-terminal cleavage/methylation domain-containing protein
MPILSVGKPNNTGARSQEPGATRRTAGVTLVEMIVVVSLIAILVGLSFPSMASGIETLRLNSAAQSVVTFINGGLNRAERRQVVVEVTIAKRENVLFLRSGEPGFERKLELPEGIKIEAILPESSEEETNGARSFMLYPGGTVPGFGVALVNRKRAQRVVRVDPITGVPQIERLPQK